MGHRDGYSFDVDLALSGKHRRTVASIRAQYLLVAGPCLLQGGGVRTAFTFGSNMPFTAVKFRAAKSVTTWSAWEANGFGDVAELPATPLPVLPQADKGHTTAGDPSIGAQRFMAHALPHPGGRVNKVRCLPARVPKPTRGPGAFGGPEVN